MKLPLRFVWGVLPIDNGNYLDPASLGTLVYDPTFDVAAPESQVWLFHFSFFSNSTKFTIDKGRISPETFSFIKLFLIV